jgi:hypothetical protein
MLATSGCGLEPQFSSVSLPAETKLSRADSVSLDGGIIFADRPSYRCMSLAELGFENVRTAADVSLIRSSCKCVQAKIVQYHGGQQRICDALRLDFLPGSASEDDLQPIYLSVVVTIEPKRGDARKFVVKVVEAQPVL